MARSGLKLGVLFLLVLWGALELTFLAGLWSLRKVRRVGFAPRIERLTADQRQHLEDFLARGEGRSVDHDAELGWIPKLERNAAGMRDDREYTPEPAPGVLRIAAFGDSFTYAEDVALEESWGKQLAALDPQLEVLNYGSGAYGFDQAYLRYLRRGREYAPHVVFLGYMSENLARNVNVYRPFYHRAYSGAIFTKPRFVLREGELVLLENPLATPEDYERLLADDEAVLRRLGEHDYHYQKGYAAGPFDLLPSIRFAKVFRWTVETTLLDPIFRWDGAYEPGSEAFRVTLRLFERFHEKVVEDGASPVVLIFPDGMGQRRSRRGEPRRYAPLLDELHARGYRVIELLDALDAVADRHSVEELTVAWGHFSPLANRLTAEHVYAKLVDWELAPATGGLSRSR